MEKNSDFCCDTCDDLIKGVEVKKILSEAESAASRKIDRKYAIDHMEKFIVQYQKLLHPQNYVMLSVKMKLGYIYGNMPPTSILAKMSKEELDHKLSCCQDAMNVLNILDEGNLGESIWKNRLQHEIIKTKFILQQFCE